MNQPDTARIVLIGALALLSAAGLALAQDAEASNEEQARASAEAETVYTTDYLKKRFEEKPEPKEVITNESLPESPEAPEPPAGAETYTNEDLRERFGGEDRQAATGEPGAGTPTPPETEAQPEQAEERPADEASLAPEERARRIAEIERELERLEKRLLAIRNPLLAGTAPATAEERTDEQGLDNAERLKRTEAKIDELKTTVEQLRSEARGTPPE